jgi:hypothetical protein
MDELKHEDVWLAILDFVFAKIRIFCSISNFEEAIGVGT